jgi:hypothetical protein
MISFPLVIPIVQSITWLLPMSIIILTSCIVLPKVAFLFCMNNGQQVGFFAGLHDNWKVDKSQLALCAIMCESSALGVDRLVFNGFVV